MKKLSTDDEEFHTCEFSSKLRKVGKPGEREREREEPPSDNCIEKVTVRVGSVSLNNDRC